MKEKIDSPLLRGAASVPDGEVMSAHHAPVIRNNKIVVVSAKKKVMINPLIDVSELTKMSITLYLVESIKQPAPLVPAVLFCEQDYSAFLYVRVIRCSLGSKSVIVNGYD